MGLAIAPGAALLGAVTPLAGGWIARLTLALATVAIGVAIRDFDAMRGAPGAAWLLLTVSAAGIYLAVPDTELARVLLGVSIPFALLSIPKPLCRVGPAGSAAVAGLFVWVVVVGGRGRPGSVVGGLACLGILLAEPLGRRWVSAVMTLKTVLPHQRSRRPEDEYLLAAAVAAIAQAAIAIYAARIAGTQDDVLYALLVMAPVAALAVVAAPLLYGEPPPRFLPPKQRHDPTRRHSSSGRRHSGHRSSSGSSYYRRRTNN